MKTCSKCGRLLDLSMFTRDRTRTDGLFPQCRECRRVDKRAYYQRNHTIMDAKSREWHAKNPERSRAIKKRYSDRHATAIRQRRIERRQAAPDYFRELSRRSYARNKDRIMAYQYIYFAKHPERRKAIQQRYYQRYRDRILEQSRVRYANNPEKHNRRVRAWSARNPDKVLSYVHRRRARRLQNGGSYTLSEWESLKAQYDYICLCCGQREPEIKLTVDHVVPLSRGGSNDISNLQPLCMYCNQSKQSKVIDYRLNYRRNI